MDAVVKTDKFLGLQVLRAFAAFIVLIAHTKHEASIISKSQGILFMKSCIQGLSVSISSLPLAGLLLFMPVDICCRKQVLSKLLCFAAY